MDRPRVVSVDSARPAAAAIAEAVAVLRAGGLVAFPTETVYGLGGLALDPSSVARIFAAKGRPSTHPLIAHVEGTLAARRLVADLDPIAERLMRAFWPGPLTLVLPRAPHVPREVAGGGDTIAVRAPAHPVARALVQALGEPIAAPSANRYQTLSPTLASHVVKSLGDRVDLVLDGGAAARGIESTVVATDGGRVTVLRPGALGLAALRDALPEVEVRLASAESDGEARATPTVPRDAPRPSPGMDARHYAPRAELIVVAGRDVAIARAAHEGATRSGRAGLVLCGDPAAAVPPNVELRVLACVPAAYEAALFATLHELDDAACACVVVERPPDEEPWLAAHDRLRRASTP